MWLVEVGVILLEDVYLCGGVPYVAQAMPKVAHTLLLLSADLDTEFSASLACLAGYFHGSCHDQ